MKKDLEEIIKKLEEHLEYIYKIDLEIGRSHRTVGYAAGLIFAIDIVEKRIEQNEK